MEHYKILGVDENASMEEVKKAYEDKCKKFREEIKDERKAKAFLKLFDKAYAEIKLEREKLEYQQTIIINRPVRLEKTMKLKEVENDIIDEKVALNKNRDKSYNNTKNKVKQNKNKHKKKLKKEKGNGYKQNKKRVNKRKDISIIGKIIRIILKIIAFPIVFTLTILIFLCKVISLISWIASKAAMIAAIALAAIHGYQIYKGEVANYNIFFISAIAFIIGLLLPNIVRILPSILEKINNIIKRYIY